MSATDMETATSARSDDIEGSGDGERRERGLDGGDREAESTKHLSFLFAALEVRRNLSGHRLCVCLDGMCNYPPVLLGNVCKCRHMVCYNKRCSRVVSCSKYPAILFKFVSLSCQR